MVLILVLRTSSPGNEAGKMAESFVNFTVEWTCLNYNEIPQSPLFFFFFFGHKVGETEDVLKRVALGTRSDQTLYATWKLMRHLRHQYPASLTEFTSVLESCQRILKTLSRIKMFNKVLFYTKGHVCGYHDWRMASLFPTYGEPTQQSVQDVFNGCCLSTVKQL